MTLGKEIQDYRDNEERNENYLQQVILNALKSLGKEGVEEASILVIDKDEIILTAYVCAEIEEDHCACKPLTPHDVQIGGADIDSESIVLYADQVLPDEETS